MATTDVAIMLPPGAVKSPEAPRWYFTSPEPWALRGSRLPSNSPNTWAYDLPTMLARTFSRPRWAMPITTSSSCSSAAALITESSSGISDSPPSSEKRFCPTYLVCRNVSNASEVLRRRRMWSCSSRLGRACGFSTRDWIQARSSGFWMCMYSMPTVRQ